jgi:predicted HicB family RNase H-like nuclease
VKYKGYTAVVTLDEDQGILFGRVLGLRDVITFEATTVAEAIEEFHATIDFYLEACAADCEEPDRPYSGNFQLRIDPELHRRLAVAAQERGQSLNSLVEAAVRAEIEGDDDIDEKEEAALTRIRAMKRRAEKQAAAGGKQPSKRRPGPGTSAGPGPS